MTDRKKVVITRKIPSPGIDLLKKQDWDLSYNDEDRALSREELLEKVVEADGVLCMLHDRIDEALLSQCKRVRVFSNFAVGYNNIDIEACRKRGIRVTNTPGVLTDATADLAFTLLMATARRVVEADAFLRKGNWNGWSPMLLLGADITGRTLGIIGAGRIGRAVAERGAKGFGMKILYTNGPGRSGLTDWERDVGGTMVDLETLLKESDFVSIHCPLTEETRHLIGKQELRKMKRSAILINTARGPVVNESDLVEALRDGVIAGAGLDVFENEPETAPGLIDLPNTVLLPHLGSATHRTRDEMSRLSAVNLICVLNGEEPPHPVV